MVTNYRERLIIFILHFSFKSLQNHRRKVQKSEASLLRRALNAHGFVTLCE